VLVKFALGQLEFRQVPEPLAGLSVIVARDGGLQDLTSPMGCVCRDRAGSRKPVLGSVP